MPQDEVNIEPRGERESSPKQVNVRLPGSVYEAFGYAAAGRSTSMPRLLEVVVTEWVIDHAEEITLAASAEAARAEALVRELGRLVSDRTDDASP